VSLRPRAWSKTPVKQWSWQQIQVGGFVGSTVIFMALIFRVAHHLLYADHIIALSADGRVIEEGCYQDLMKSQGYVSMISRSAKAVNTSRAPDIKFDDETLQGLNMQEDQTEDLSRRTGDMTVYSFYFQKIGWPLLTIFLTCCVLFILGLSFPREFAMCIEIPGCINTNTSRRDMAPVVDSS
jgi:hypothetical protein